MRVNFELSVKKIKKFKMVGVYSIFQKLHLLHTKASQNLEIYFTDSFKMYSGERDSWSSLRMYKHPTQRTK